MKIKNYFKTSLLTLTVALSITSCKKDNENEQVLVQEITATKGIYILNEGSSGDKNSTISYYDIEKKTVVKDYYKQINGTALGETANDLKAYGSKLYCVVTGDETSASSFVDVMNINTGKTIKRISFNVNEKGKMPRFITFYKNKAYVSSYDGTINRIDTTSLNIDTELQLKNGADNAVALEDLAVANGKLYVAGSDHYLYANGLKNKVVIIDLATFKLTKDITVNHNPQKIVATEAGDILVSSWGDNSNPALQKINGSTDEIVGTYPQNVGAMGIYKNTAYLTTDWGANVISFNTTTGTAGASFVIDGTLVTTAYSVSVNTFDQSVVIADAVNYGATGKAFVFGQDGKIKYSFETGQNPKTAAFNYNYRYVYKPL